jgi:DNA polymerase III subunit chi
MSAPEVQFHTGLAEPELYVCRLLRKAVRQGVRVQVTAAEDLLLGLDRLIWTFEERDFVPHVRIGAVASELAARTPIWLTPVALAADAHRVLLNLGADPPSVHLKFDRIIEVVSSDAEEARRGRERWRHYKGLGLAVRHVAEPGAAPG